MKALRYYYYFFFPKTCYCYWKGKEIKFLNQASWIEGGRFELVQQKQEDWEESNLAMQWATMLAT